MWNKSLKFILLAFIVPFLWGCLPFTPSSETSESQEADADDTFFSIALQIPPSFQALQDQPFQFNPVVTISGLSFAIQNKPSWLSIDSSTGKLSGVPDAIGVHSNIIVRVFKNGAVLEESNPFTIQVLGDPLVTQAWHLNNTGQNAFSQNPGTAGEDIKMRDVLRQGITGNGVKIAVSDSGMEMDHPDLEENVLTALNRNYGVNPPYGKDPSPPIDFLDGDHGTSVAGLIGAEGWNGLGSRGVAPRAGIAGFRYIEFQNAAIDLDQAQGDFDIFNQSWGIAATTFFTPISLAYRMQIKAGTDTGRSGKGSLYVRSAGNDGNQLIPSSLSGLNTIPYVVVIGALNAQGRRPGYGSFGSNLWVSAPAGEFGTTTPAMITTDLPSCDRGYSQTAATFNNFEKGGVANPLNQDCNYTSTFNGTSSAAPVTSGVIALMLEANPNLSWRDVKYILAATSTQVHANFQNVPIASDPPGFAWENPWITNAAGFKFHNWYGFGRVNSAAAVTMAKNFSSPLGSWTSTTLTTEDDWKYSSGNINLPIPDFNATGVSSTLAVTDNLVIEAVQIRISATHPGAGNQQANVGELSFELISPQGTKNILLNSGNRLASTTVTNALLLSNAYYGETSQGTWTLKVIDPVTGGGTARLTGWQINFYGYIP